VDDVDVETFPTLLIGQGARVFLGPLLPQHAVLERLVASFIDGAPATPSCCPRPHRFCSG
jgi:hypothetical protein